MRKNYFHYRAMLRDIVRSSGDPKLFSIPYNIAIDNENNVVKVKDYANSRNHTLVIREGNALHPLDSGYQQCADYFYAWMKYQLTRP